MFQKFILIIALLIIPLFAKDNNMITKNIDEFLASESITVNTPAMYEKDNKDLISDLLKYDYNNVADWLPADGEKFGGSTVENKWKTVSSPLTLKAENKVNLVYAGFYINVNRYIDAELRLVTGQSLRIWMDGKEIETKLNDCGDKKQESLSSNLKLENGKHFILIKAISTPAEKTTETISANITYDEKFGESSLTITTDPVHTYGIKTLLDDRKVDGFSLSCDGNIASLKLRERNYKTDSYESWIELRKVSDASLITTLRGGMNVQSLKWANTSETFAYTTSSDDAKTLWVVNIKDGTNEPLLEKVDNMGNFEWAPDDSYIVYTVTEKAKVDDPDFKKYDLPEDRWPGFREKEFIYRVFIDSKFSERLTAGKESTSFIEISQDSKKVLYSKTHFGQTQRPYERADYFILNLEDMKVDSVVSLFFSTGASWSPDGTKLLIYGGATTFGDIGLNVSNNIIPNDYDTQVYIYDLESGSAEAISKEFNPSISSAYWDKTGNVIYFIVSEQSYSYLYKYSLESKSYEKVDLGSEVIGNIEFSKDFSTALFSGSSSVIHPQVYKYDVSSGDVSLFLDAESKDYEKIKLGNIEDWDFVSSIGPKIKGRVYYPPDFDESKKYPAIVYYYGGTSPVERNFEGRYPYNYWAANGYIIYVLQPTGATGFGQELSAHHVNDWGDISGREIIEGVGKFLDAHKFVDPERVGCIGASYGGFETMSLITKTDIFAAAISHAGISNLTSYWGVGYWGYQYNAVAGADSFPWNKKDEYINKSPLFNADKINTPLLLLHGNIDPNVPPGESMQMYVALKLLGKDVSFVEVDKQEHWILDYNKRTKWSKTIIAYFDKYLKGQPEWWNSLY